MVEGVAYGWLWKLVSWLPGFLLRWRFSKKALADRIRIDVPPRHTAVQINGGEITEAAIYLQIHNRGYFPVELDRMTVQLILAGSAIEYFYLDRTPIPPDTTCDIHVRGPLPRGLVDHYARNIKNGDVVSLLVRAELNSKIHNFSVNTGYLNGIQPRNINMPALPSIPR